MASFARPKVEVISLTLVCCCQCYTYCESQFPLGETANSKVPYLACELMVLHLRENGVECTQTNNVTGNLAIFASSLAHTIFTLTDFNSHVCFFSAMLTQLIVQMI
jgi:hypothetical protein